MSGLVWLSEERAKSYGFVADYPDLVRRVLRGLLADPAVHVALVPHVIEPLGHYESDLEACNGLIASEGEFAWGGAASTGFWVDPQEDLICVVMTQQLPSSQYPIRRELRNVVNGCLT